jgi:MFS family permease
MPQTEPNHRIRVFYGWYILAASFVTLFFTSGVRYSIGVVFKPLMADFGWNRGLISSAFFLNMTFYALSIIIAGKYYDRYGPKWVIIISNVLLSIGFMGLAFIDSFWQFLVLYGIVAALGMGGTTVPLFAALMTKWFEKRRGFAVSSGLTGSCIGQFVLVPLFTVFVLRYGWRVSYFYISLVMLVTITLLTLFIIKGDPDDLGLEPYGHKNKDRPGDRSVPESADIALTDLGLTDAMKTYSFWIFVIVMIICGSGDFLIATHLIPMVTDYNISAATAGNMLAWLGLMSLAGILVVGPISDVIGVKIPISLTMLLRVLLFLLILNYQNRVSFYIFSFAFGFTFLITAPLNAILVGRLYGFTHVGLISGFISTLHHFGGGFWVYVGGELFDQTGSYRLILLVSMGMAFFAGLIVLFIKEKRHRVAV